MKATIRLYHRIKWHNVILLFLFITILLSWNNIVAFGGTATVEDSICSYQQITVQPGDSLWSLIKEKNPEYQGRMDKIIWETQQINQLSDSFLKTGSTLLIPINL